MYRGGPPRGRGGWGPRGGGRGWGPRRGGRGGGGGWGPRRGGPMRGPGGRNRGPMAPPPSVFIQHIPFDFVICENSFPRIRPELSEEDIITSMKSRDDQIRPNEDQFNALKKLHDDIVSGINKAKESSGESDFITSDTPDHQPEFQILDHFTIGSFTRNCILKDSLKVDISLVISTLPTHETVGQVSRTILNQMKEMKLESAEKLVLQSADYGFDMMMDDMTIAIWLTIPPERMQELCPGTHISPELCQMSQRAIKHTQWYIQTVQNSERDTSEAPLITRLMRDLRNRNQGFFTMSKWVCDLLVTHCIMNHPRYEETGKLNPAKVMRRILQLLAAGIFLPNSVGLSDPTENGYVIHSDWAPTDMDQVCLTAQTLLRIWSHGGHMAVLGLEQQDKKIADEMTVWNDICVTPSESVIRAA